MLKLFGVTLFIIVPVFTLRGNLRKRPPPAPKSNYDPTDQYFDQVLDHFNPIDERTWSQRYWESWDNYVEGGPAFIMIGGEGEEDPGWLDYGAWYKMAKENGAAMFILEHRYYGQSRPTEDMSTENMKFLSSRQALEDVAHFITAMNAKYNITVVVGAEHDDIIPSWITFGGSYPGSLSAWARLRFPHLVLGAVSSSGPLLAKLDFFEYLQVVADSLDTTGPGCNLAVTEAINTLEGLIADGNELEELSTLFKLCSPLDGTNELDVKGFLGIPIDNLAGVVQYNGFYEEDIFSICALMVDESLGSPMERLAVVNDVMLQGEECVDHTYEAWRQVLIDTDWEGIGDGWRPWIWQTCTEFGWYQTTNQESEVYGHSLTLEYMEKWCQDAFGEEFTHERMQALIAESNMMYGGKQPEMHNVVFVHGSIDPWHAMGVLEDLNDDATSIYIPGTSHCADMYNDGPGDPEELLAARKQIGSLVKEWLFLLTERHPTI